MVEFAVVELHRHLDLCGFVEQILDAAAVVGHAQVDRVLCGSQIARGGRRKQ